ncbi:GntR family transcriptional regulator [Lentibacter algarum]|uniref:GntR family transcriptional regulator n=1 Tax=Lentibacter algarum TaxID=576131 RepID=UPI001C0763BB|nr:GntR family transcriptional regulator [Lentibacter algarum]MBU2981695.1 GntR family transcriptional regulator [Lentibacter algarum]
MSFRDWQSVQEEVLRRIHAREWRQGELIPTEAELAQEFGCARTTVNRALRALAEAGLLDRKRKAGTRVAAAPVAKATLDIAIIRQEVAARGAKYGYQLIDRSMMRAPAAVRGAMQVTANCKTLHVQALHMANATPYALEDRWIDCEVVPQALVEPFDTISANEWLLQHVPYTHGDIAISAKAADADEAAHLCCPEQAALLAIDRLTWDGTRAVTKVRLLFRPEHELRTEL